jgi:hypothetical protein
VSQGDTRRIAGGVIAGAFIGAALGWRRSWLVMLGCTIAGYFVGSEVGKRGIAINEFGLSLRLDPHDVAVIGFGIVGGIVGAVFAARIAGERREGKRGHTDSRSAILRAGEVRAPGQGVAGPTV